MSAHPERRIRIEIDGDTTAHPIEIKQRIASLVWPDTRIRKITAFVPNDHPLIASDKVRS